MATSTNAYHQQGSGTCIRHHASYLFIVPNDEFPLLSYVRQQMSIKNEIVESVAVVQYQKLGSGMSKLLLNLFFQTIWPEMVQFNSSALMPLSDRNAASWSQVDFGKTWGVKNSKCYRVYGVIGSVVVYTRGGALIMPLSMLSFQQVCCSLANSCCLIKLYSLCHLWIQGMPLFNRLSSIDPFDQTV